ncbi:MAG: hypothetical protein IPO92_00645 [Saprospiraceae bacterium]|nr:hypothetical protein [Saprospiraceae bacterium]
MNIHLNFAFCIWLILPFTLQCQTVSISGNIGLGINSPKVANNFEIILLNISTNDSVTKPIVSNEYTFENVLPGYDYKLYLKRVGEEDDYLNGISTLDQVLIQRHLLGIAPFENVYVLVAADANDDGNVSVYDQIVLRRLIIGITNKLNSSWKTLVKANPSLTHILFPNLTQNMKNQDFVLVKIGDVNGSY